MLNECEGGGAGGGADLTDSHPASELIHANERWRLFADVQFKPVLRAG